MIQTLELPLLSLAVPNINKLNDVNADSLSCMWTGKSNYDMIYVCIFKLNAFISILKM